MKILVRGDHPIGKRPDKYFTDPALATEYYNELFKEGYKNLEIITCLSDKETDKLAEKILPDVMRSNFKIV